MDTLIRIGLAGAIAGALVCALRIERTKAWREAHGGRPVADGDIPVINPIEQFDPSLAKYAPL